MLLTFFEACSSEHAPENAVLHAQTQGFGDLLPRWAVLTLSHAEFQFFSLKTLSL
jgi:hypothetical protein